MPEFRLRGYTLEDLQKLSIEEFAKKVADARLRRTLFRRLKLGFPPQWERFFEKCKLQKEGKYKKTVKTHAREIPILPFMVGCKVAVHNGKEFVEFEIKPEMIGKRLGDFSHTTKKVKHSAPGIGASRSTKFMKVK
ncbi:30S ribosomal protein S19 [Nanoarchaeota archaeon NZ13-N]|uniref:Small ribosomal subunit protein uS19 n=1 Tax=Candidatus Nanoclepta minutus TaxID=1940235 RepID=A0A397WM25_9ARCH|nr:MAG: 30S ribosomal protein S19 [Nanoarchaeota archaeon NZ13-N]RIB35078.1 MAG: 30S ribosomal protein S19 [Candidatus Nanoclepta minutus]